MMEQADVTRTGGRTQLALSRMILHEGRTSGAGRPSRRLRQRRGKTPRQLGERTMHTSNAATMAGIVMALVLTVAAATSHLRTVISTELDDATAATAASLDAAVAIVRLEIRAGRQRADRRMAEIRRVIPGPDDEDDDGATPGAARH